MEVSLDRRIADIRVKQEIERRMKERRLTPRTALSSNWLK